MKKFAIILLGLLALPFCLWAETFAITGATVYTATGDPIKNGVVLVKKGKIAAVGSADDVSIPKRAKIIDATGKHLTPGFVDIHSHLGVYSYPNVKANSDGNEMTDPITPQVRAIDSFNVADPAIKEALTGGVTTVLSRPGSGNLIGGIGVLIKLRPDAVTIDDMILRHPGDMKMAPEWNAMRAYGSRHQAPATRMDLFAMLRQKLIEAQSYVDKWDTYERKKAAGDKKAEPPSRDLKLEALAQVLRREMPVHIHCARTDEIVNSVRICEEFNLDCNLGHVAWGFKVAEFLKEHDIVSVVGPRMFREDPETHEIVCIACEMAKVGAPLAFQTDHPVVKQEYLIYQAALMVRYGVPEDIALRAITIVPAEAENIDNKIGSLEIGKDADMVLFDGPIFEVTSNVESVWIDGEIVYAGE